MNNTLKITVNILLFLLVAGFGYYMIHSMTSEKPLPPGEAQAENTFVSPYQKTNSFNTDSEIICFDICGDTVYAAQSGKVSVFDAAGKHLRDFEAAAGVRDIVADTAAVYLLYPARIEVYSPGGQKTGRWEACSDNADYCAFAVTGAHVFVTDAENKHICQYDRQGQLVRFIRSPQGFIIPSYSFDIICIRDTLYCANSGRHKIESYTPEGEFIASFGVAGAQAGAFAGCCNPAYLAQSANGHILTSEKGVPRISCYGKDGKFRTVLFDGNTLGGGTAAYEMHVSGEEIYVAGRKTISAYRFDAALSEQACAGCEAECPLRKGGER